jgi:Fe-Mn family superoxide dismutase
MERRELLKTLALGVSALSLSTASGLLAADTPASPKAAAPAPPAAPATTAGPFTLPPLGYAYDALEPFLDAQTLQIHHDKHHAAYVNNLNKALAGREEVAGWPVEQLVRDLTKVPDDIRTIVRNHGGGHANHSLLWPSLKADGGKQPTGDLARAIDAAFGSFPACVERLTAAATSVFGSGWAWLSADPAGKVVVEATPNQDSPLTGGRLPLVGIDVWEHAYYLKFQNRRADYLAVFASVIDWDAVSARYAARGK